MGLFADDLGMIPGGKGAKHVAAHDEIELVFGVLIGQMNQRHGCIAGPALIQLPVGGHEALFIFTSKLHHPEPLPAVRPLGQLLVGRDAVHHEQHRIEL